jgi:polyisoprenoid-binding protein YceI
MADEAPVEAALSPRSILLAGSGAGEWQLDPTVSTLGFQVKHFWGAVTVRGRFATVSGSLVVDASGRVSGSIEADSASVTSGNAQRDKHLRGPDFFNATVHPSVVFTLDGAEPVDDETLRITGSLTAAGHSLPITFDARLSDATHERVAVDGEVSVNRRTSFDMTWSPLGIAAPAALLSIRAVFAKSAAQTAR